jgi:hypothetical protein
MNWMETLTVFLKLSCMRPPTSHTVSVLLHRRHSLKFFFWELLELVDLTAYSIIKLAA